MFLFSFQSWITCFQGKREMHPQDEVSLYESKGKAIAEAREGGHIPGLCPAGSHY